MMIEVFVHQNRPFLRFERAKERMRMLGEHAAPSLAKRSIAAIRSLRSRSKSHLVWSVRKSSGDEGELRRMGLLFRKTNGLISRPMTLAGNGARLGLITPFAI